MNRLLFFSIIVILSACASKQTTSSYKFDKQKWGSSSAYRYEITKEKEFFMMIKEKSKSKVKRILGFPDFINDDGSFVYCLVIPTKGDKKCDESSSILIIGFEKGNPYNITIVKVEP